MIDITEHACDDDPGQRHPDVRTRLKDASYFFLGNGLIQAAVQFAPGGEGTPLGLLVMNPEHPGMKREALTFDPAAGLEPTMARVVTDAGERTPDAATLEVEWSVHHGVPAVLARWACEGFDIRELFYCPDRHTPRLAREVFVRASASAAHDARLRTGPRGSSVERPLALRPGAEARAWLLYTLDAAGRRVHVSICSHDPLEQDARQFWTRSAHGTFGDGLIDRWFNASRWQLPAVVSRHGRLDGSPWHDTRERIRDQAFVALGLVMAGHGDMAAVILRRLLREFVTDEGATIESGALVGGGSVGLDRNGILLFVLSRYVAWTGDRELAAGLWDKVAAAAEFPLRSEFRHEPSGMLCSAREFWDRHGVHGIEPGLELADQQFVAMGLASAALLARMLSHTREAARWDQAARALKDAVLSHPTFALVDDRGFVKRRGLDGSVQEEAEPLPEAGLPAGVPLAGPGPHRLNPDTSAVLPLAFGFVDAALPVAAATLASVGKLWNVAWTGGGYGRYEVSSEIESPGGWPVASLFVARAALEAGRHEDVWRVLRWLETVPGAAAGSWFECYGERVAPPLTQVGVAPRTWAEVLILLVHHVLGVRPGVGNVRLRPRLLAGLERVTASVPVCGRWLHIDLQARAGGAAASCRVDGRPVEPVSGQWAIPTPSDDVTVEMRV